VILHTGFLLKRFITRDHQRRARN